MYNTKGLVRLIKEEEEVVKRISKKVKNNYRKFKDNSEENYYHVDYNKYSFFGATNNPPHITDYILKEGGIIELSCSNNIWLNNITTIK